MFAGDRARKENLVKYGFRLPSAFDNRPLCFDEFYDKLNQIVFEAVSTDKVEDALKEVSDVLRRRHRIYAGKAHRSLRLRYLYRP